MTRLFMPALYLMSKLSFRQKFILISALFMVPLLGYMYLLSTQMSIETQVAQKEIGGTKFVKPLSRTLNDAVEEQIFAHAFYVGGDQVQSDLQKSQSALDKDFQELDALNRQQGGDSDIGQSIDRLSSTWQELKANTSAQEFASLNA